MNVKVIIATKIVKFINVENNMEENDTLSSLVSDCDDLIARYASLSLDLSALHTEASGMNIFYVSFFFSLYYFIF